jgi:PleD family two-component response regulator
MRTSQLILVVDDSPFAARALVHVLESRGLQARGASSLEEAMRICTEWHPSVLVTDVRMPNIDVYDLCCRFRAAAGERRTAVLLFSAQSEEAMGDLVALTGADAFMEKLHGATAVAARVEQLCASITDKAEEQPASSVVP